MNEINDPLSNSNPDSNAERINDYLVTVFDQTVAITRRVSGYIWLCIGGALCVLGFLVGFGTLLKLAVWILIGAFLLLTIAYGAGVISDARSKGLMGSSGKLAAICCALVAVVLFLLLPQRPSSLKKTTNYSSIANSSSLNTSSKDATLAYWDSLKSVTNRCERASQELEALFTGDSEGSTKSNPFDKFRHEFLKASKELNSLSLTDVDPAAVELAIEMDAILLESVATFDEIIEFGQSQWTVGGFMKALFIGTKDEEAQMSERQKRLQDRAIRWSEQQTKVRIELSKRFGITFPPLDPPK